MPRPVMNGMMIIVGGAVDGWRRKKWSGVGKRGGKKVWKITEGIKKKNNRKMVGEVGAIRIGRF